MTSLTSCLLRSTCASFACTSEEDEGLHLSPDEVSLVDGGLHLFVRLDLGPGVEEALVESALKVVRGVRVVPPEVVELLVEPTRLVPQVGTDCRAGHCSQVRLSSVLLLCLPC